MKKLLLILLLIATSASAQVAPVSLAGSISSVSGKIPFPLAGNTSVRFVVWGTFVANWMVTAWNDPDCTIGGQVTQHGITWVGKGISVTPLNDPQGSGVGVFVIPYLDGVQCVQLQIYTTTGAGYTSGTIYAHFSATMAPAATSPMTGAHNEGPRVSLGQGSISLNTRPACSFPTSPCTPAAVSAVGAANALTLNNALSQVACVYRIVVNALDAPWTGRITIDDGTDGEAIDFGVHTILKDGPAWERSGSPLYCSDAGNDPIVKATGSAGSRTKIQAVAGR